MWLCSRQPLRRTTTPDASPGLQTCPTAGAPSLRAPECVQQTAGRLPGTPGCAAGPHQPVVSRGQKHPTKLWPSGWNRSIHNVDTHSAAEAKPLHPSIQVMLRSHKPCSRAVALIVPSTGQPARASAHAKVMAVDGAMSLEWWHLRKQARVCVHQPQVQQRKQHAVVDAPSAIHRPCSQRGAKAQELQRSRCRRPRNEPAWV